MARRVIRLGARAGYAALAGQANGPAPLREQGRFGHSPLAISQRLWPFPLRAFAVAELMLTASARAQTAHAFASRVSSTVSFQT